MSALSGFGIVAGIATFAGIALAVYYGRREGSRKKTLGFQMDIAPVPVASSRSLAAYDLELVYKPRGELPRQIDSAFVHYLRFANFGREPIRRDDIAPRNPLRITVEGTELLDATVEAVRREVTRIELGSISSPLNEAASVPITFDFLDFHDGAVVRLLTTSQPEQVGLVGDIIGMPDGIKTAAELRGRRTLWGPVGAALVILFELSALALCVFAFHLVVGGWRDAWILVLPIVAFIAPLLASAFISDTLWPKPGPNFPKELRRRLRMGPYFVSGDFNAVVLESRRIAEISETPPGPEARGQ